MTTCLWDGYCDSAVVQMDVPERCHRLTAVSAALQLGIVMENPSPVSARPSWAAEFGQKMHFASRPWGAQRERQTEEEEWPRLCPTIYTNPTLCLAEGSAKIIKTPSSLCVERWSHRDAIMLSGDGAKIHSGRNYSPKGGSGVCVFVDAASLAWRKDFLTPSIWESPLRWKRLQRGMLVKASHQNIKSAAAWRETVQFYLSLGKKRRNLLSFLFASG